ncbi:head GIN domain-containing protein [Pontibacter sp. 13R65]|uniref:head GIN domain-containing protein n=1 Tax=Pontibacter sp. 13R65 TaxID=3127458 RepID=UPI00301D907D
MKPNFFSINGYLCLLALGLLSACGDEARCKKGEGSIETRTFELANLKGVKVNGSSKVYISKGNRQRVEVRAEPNVLDDLNRDISNGIWDVETESCFRKHETIEVYITVPTLTHAEVNGSGEINLQNRFDVDEFKTLINGSGKIKANFTADHAITQISGSGDAEINGIAEQQDVSISGSGKAHTYGLATDRSLVKISGSGEAEVSVNTILEADISGSGKIYYKGNPTVTTNISGSGKVEKR